MAIDQAGLNSLLANLQPRSNLAALRQRRENLLRKLQQGDSSGQNDRGQAQSGDAKPDIKELASIEQQLSQEVYDDTYRRLEEERLKLEAAWAQKERDRERALAKHERLLESRCLGKILSAASKVGRPDSCALGSSQSDGQGSTYQSEVDNDLHESVEYGKAAADVGRRRKNAETKAQIEETAERHQAARRKKTKHVNIII